MRLVPLVVLAIGCLAGCTPAGPQFGDIRDTLPVLLPGRGRIFFYREPEFMGMTIRVLLSGAEVGDLEPGSIFFFDCEPRKNYMVGAPSGQVATSRDALVSIAEGDIRFVKFQSGSTAWFEKSVQAIVVAPYQAKEETANLVYLGSLKSGDRSGGG